MSLRIGTYRAVAPNGEDSDDEAFSGCPCGVLSDGESEAVVHCWRTGPQPSGIGIEVNEPEQTGRGLAYGAMAEVASGWPLSEFHIYYSDGKYEFIGGSE